MQRHKKQKGFTLIELLVVVSIIGLLSSVVFASLQSVRMRARDAKRISELRVIADAINLYYDDHGDYPPYQESNSFDGGNWNSMGNDLSKYLGKMPHDPLENSSCFNDSPYSTGANCYGYYYFSAPNNACVINLNAPIGTPGQVDIKKSYYLYVPMETTEYGAQNDHGISDQAFEIIGPEAHVFNTGDSCFVP
jgi:prepilin-type N-terminal cleavage/methylation domain-containing protein